MEVVKKQDFSSKSIEFSLRTKFALGQINNKRAKSGETFYYSYIKPLQMRGIISAVQRDTLTILPTGYGKSLIFELLPQMLQSKIIIISPLNAIISEQLAKLGDRSLRIDTELLTDLTSGK